jgi:hypothetical protein
VSRISQNSDHWAEVGAVRLNLASGLSQFLEFDQHANAHAVEKIEAIHDLDSIIFRQIRVLPSKSFICTFWGPAVTAVKPKLAAAYPIHSSWLEICQQYLYRFNSHNKSAYYKFFS